MLTTAPTNWDELLPTMFTDPRFHQNKKNRRRWYAVINGCRAGIVVASRTANFDNHSLNKEDIDQLLKLRKDGTFDVVFIVLASVGENYASEYIDHRDAEQLYETLQSVLFRKGPYGEYTLLCGDFTLLDAEIGFPGW